jgi:outer membrane protein assembly factor BamB
MSTPRRTWLTIAATAATFAFIVLVVMLVIHAAPRGENPFDAEEWRALKAELAAKPGDPEATERLRVLDLELRRAFFERRDRIRVGGSLLLIGLVLALVAVKGANRRTLPEPAEPATPVPDAERDRHAARARVAVGVTGLLVGAGAIYLCLAIPAALALPAGDLGPVGTERAPPMIAERARQWPSFRGHDGSGIAPTSDAPRSWDGASGKNIAWKTPIPLPGHNSPILWDDRVFLTGADAEREEVYCIDAHTGAMLWKRALVVVGRRGEPAEPMDDTGYAAPTAATDGRYVFVMFASGRVAALDMDGAQVWLRSFGPLDNTYGHSSSLALFRDHVLVQLDQGLRDKPVARLVALDAATGETVWTTPRLVDSSWASPIVCTPPSGPQVVLSATPIAAAYDPTSGAEIWRADILHGEVAPTPIHRDGVIYLLHEDVGLFAVRADGRGDVTKTHVLWNVPGGAPDVASPVCDGERVYMLTSAGTLTCFRAKSGEMLWEHDLEADYYSSPSLAGRVLYVTSMAGVTTTVETGSTFKALGTNPLGEEVFASMAFGHGRIYLRGKKHLFAIGGPR